MLGRPATHVEDRIEVFGATGTAAIYRRAMLDDIGGFDASYGSYYEDVDVAWRARMRGWRCLVAARAVVHHKHSASFGHGSASKHYLVGRNRIRTLAKDASRGQLCRSLLLIVAYDSAYVAYAAVRHRTLAPLRGRLQGLAEWRRYRRSGATLRTPVQLARPPGFRAALARDKIYGSGPSVC
jgi:GT2 family glycosyltransferase